MPHQFARQRDHRRDEMAEIEACRTIGVVRFREAECSKNKVAEGQRAREEYRRAQTRMTEQSAERRPKDKAESESSTDEAHPFGAIALVGRVGDVSLGSRNRRGAGAVNRA